MYYWMIICHYQKSVLKLLPTLISGSGQECKKKMTIKHEYSDKALIGHTFMTKHANDAEHCQALCFMHMENGCISVTFDTQKMLCNLSDSDQIMHPEHLVDASNAIFWSTEVRNPFQIYQVIDFRMGNIYIS